MEKKNIQLSSRTAELWSDFLLGKLNTSEMHELEQWLDESPENFALAKAILNENELNKLGTFYKTLDVDAHLKSALFEAGISIQNEPIKQKKFKIWHLAAASIFVIMCGFVLFNQFRKLQPEQKIANVADVNPGQLGATLTLSNGKRIKLSDATTGQLANESGIKIIKTRDGQLFYELGGSNSNGVNTLSTANGETYNLRLPDGTLVWLNSASTITYNAGLLADGKRIVKLSGEGYFEVAADKMHPFIVKTDQQEIQVLGTHFNVNSYKDEPYLSTTLIEGSVRLKAGGKEHLLYPGEEARVNDSSISVNKANLETILDWRNAEFSFGHINFRTAMRKIERWYDVEFIYDSTFPTDLEGGGWISRNKKLSSVLEFIESTRFARFRIDGKKVYVTKY